MIEYICLDCGMPYPADGLPYRCASCGGIFTLRGLSYDAGKKTSLPGMWAYRDLIARPIFLSAGLEKAEPLWSKGQFRDAGFTQNWKA
jgi:DNA-directed RNA polymerase subunit RPC12/RpoP